MCPHMAMVLVIVMGHMGTVTNYEKRGGHVSLGDIDEVSTRCHDPEFLMAGLAGKCSRAI